MEEDQSELSLKGCQACRNPIQYQYRSTAGRAGELLGSAAVSFTVVSAAAACQRPPPTPSYPPPLPQSQTQVRPDRWAVWAAFPGSTHREMNTDLWKRRQLPFPRRAFALAARGCFTVAMSVCMAAGCFLSRRFTAEGSLIRSNFPFCSHKAKYTTVCLD